MAEHIDDGPDGAVLTYTTGHGVVRTLRARWIHDSRPPAAAPAARSALLQHFRGWFVHCERPSFDARTVELMDFRTAQPERGLSFGYVLPTSGHAALVEYTEFSRSPLTAAAYEDALRDYAGRVLGLGAFRVLGTEQGAIPMSGS
ncbi:lycopene cyclase family protein [Streptomyces sp. NPDC096136]|uniref:lycopene cyclase family protein n=1 Tax=Streptomyces sp. NPDC096136 TaxID=3366076 RepID=UPI0037F62ADD